MRARGDDGVLQAPAAVGIGDDDVLGPGGIDHTSCPRGILVRIGADLELEAVDPFLPPGLHVGGHLLRRAERYGEVEREVVGEPAAEEVADREPGRATEGVPAGGVDGALRVAVPHQRPVHGGVDRARVARLEPEHGGRELVRALPARRAPWAGRYAGPSGQTSPKPVDATRRS